MLSQYKVQNGSIEFPNIIIHTYIKNIDTKEGQWVFMDYKLLYKGTVNIIY